MLAAAGPSGLGACTPQVPGEQAPSAPAAKNSSRLVIGNTQQGKPPVRTVEIRADGVGNLSLGHDPAIVRIRANGPDTARLAWSIHDYFDRLYAKGDGPVRLWIDVRVPDPGYFKVYARVTDGPQLLAQARDSLGHLFDAAPVQHDEGFTLGAWIQQDDLLPVMGAAWTRGGVGWREIEPEPGRIEFAALDSYEVTVRRFRSAGIRPIVRFGQFPAWVSRHRDYVPADRREAFRRYVSVVVRRLAGVVDHWEVLNEPQRADGYYGEVDDIVALHRIVHEEVRRLDPDGLVLGPSMNPRRPEIFEEIRSLFEHGLARYVDGVSVHTYPGPGRADFVSGLARLHALLAEFGAQEKPVFITEHGLSVPADPSREREQARELVRTNLLAMQAGVKAVIWHLMSWPQAPTDYERNFEIVTSRLDSGARSPRPAFVAAATLARVLASARFGRTLVDAGESAGVQLYDRDGEPVVVAWNNEVKRLCILLKPGSGTIKLTDIVGNTHPVETVAGSIVLEAGPDPVYLLGTHPDDEPAMVSCQLADSAPDPPASTPAVLTVRTPRPRPSSLP